LTAGKTAFNVERTVLQHLPLLSQWIAYTNNIQTGIKMKRTIEDFKDELGAWVQSKSINGVQMLTRAGNFWQALRRRGTEDTYFRKNNPNYEGCTVGFKDFAEFADWANYQKGYLEDGWHIDKDILGKGRKVYSPDTCVFVPTQINSLFTHNKSNKGIYPVGVAWNKRREKFRASIRVDGIATHIGYYDTPEIAFQAYKTRKEKQVKEVAGRYVGRISDECYLALMKYVVEP
jgi:hypothetical protein